MTRLVFHSPLNLDRAETSGSSVRPLRMLEAFTNIGVSVLRCDGTSSVRENRINSLLSQYGHGDIIGVYSELSTLPIALTDPDHLPRSPFLDYKFFRKSKSKGWPVGAYYRDLHWKFPEYGGLVEPWKQLIKLPFYHLELWQIRHAVDHLFLPSKRMLDFVPGSFPEGRTSALPPAGRIANRQSRHPARQSLRLLYVGGVVAPLYDLTIMLKAVAALDDVRLRICCREAEWQAVRHLYTLSDNVTIVHAYGDALSELYNEADVFLMPLAPARYYEFAMPVKLFEALGWGIPVITTGGTSAGDLVTTEQCGWTVNSDMELTSLLRRINNDPAVLKAAEHRTETTRIRHTWRERAKEVISTLEDYRGSRTVK